MIGFFQKSLKQRFVTLPLARTRCVIAEIVTDTARTKISSGASLEEKVAKRPFERIGSALATFQNRWTPWTVIRPHHTTISCNQNEKKRCPDQPIQNSQTPAEGVPHHCPNDLLRIPAMSTPEWFDLSVREREWENPKTDTNDLPQSRALRSLHLNHGPVACS